MSSLVKKIGNAVSGAFDAIGGFVKKLGPEALILAAVIGAPMLAGPAMAGSTALVGAEAAAAGGALSAAAGGMGVVGAGTAAGVASMGLGAMGSLSRTFSSMLFNNAGQPISSLVKMGGAIHDQATGQGFFGKLFQGIKGFASNPLDWIEKHPTATNFIGSALKNYSEAKAADEERKNEPKYYGTYYGYTPEGERYDIESRQMVPHGTSQGLIAPQAQAAPSGPSVQETPRETPIERNTQQFAANPVQPQAPEVGKGLITSDPSEQPTSGFNYVSPGVITPSYRRLG